MKRKLTDIEKEATKKGLKISINQLELLEESLEYNLAVLQKQKEQRIFDDKFRPYLRKQKDTQDKQSIDLLKSDIKIVNEKVEIAKKHLKEGVEKKQGADYIQ